ncbi:MAG: FAD-dependent thymidylate synthase [Syntrophobacterales bacterium]|jgi:thymidylate synthase (FAD)|nr:FAD-dependent thymidylate synthase [Syntrophobacterales bacterium]
MMETKLKVLLISHTPEPEGTVAAAARLCYRSGGIDTLKGEIPAGQAKAFLNKLMGMGHMSPVEHVSFTFAIEGISRTCSHQLVRHRLASYSQQSQRYVSKTAGFQYVIPPVIDDDEEMRTRFKTFMKETQKFYNYLVARLEEKGLKGESVREDARFVLPNAAETKIIVTMNARELLHFFAQRCCNRAQWEIRRMATEMLKLARNVAPTLFAFSGPSCVKGPCPEGAYSCGRMKEVRKRFRSLL